MKTIYFDAWKTPNEEVVKYFAYAFDISFHRDEDELRDLFRANNSLTNEIIDLRVRRLNALYHTHLWEGHIKNIVQFLTQGGNAFEQQIRSGEVSVVGKLANIGNRNCFVFATKYCSFVNPKEYPIYDSFVANVLLHFHEENPLIENERISFERIRMDCDYSRFKEIVDVFKNQYKLNNCDYKELDKFLWLVGKNFKKKF